MNANYKFTHLMSPFKINGTKFKNRFIFLPHHTGYAYDHGYMENGLFSERNIKHYIDRAKGGAAAVTVSQNVDPFSQMSPRYVLGFEPRNRDNFKRLADEAHQYDCKVITQLNHGGHTSLLNPPQLLYAPTQMPEPYCHFNTKELERDEMEMIKEYYVNSSKFQKELGWDGVELKIAHDGLLRTFVSPFFNRRKDEYGGSFVNRMKYPLEIISAIRKEVGSDYPIGIRLCMDEFTSYGYSLGYGLELAKALEDGGVDYISTDAGTFSSWFLQIPPAFIPLGFAVYMCAELKKVINIPIIAFGRINDPIQSEAILEDNHADLIGMCRQLICDPETPNKTMEGRLDDIRHCIGCNEGCVGKDGIDVECVQNPAAGREKMFGIGTLNQVKEKKKMMVVGAGISGMKVAEIAAKRGHNVEIYEKTENVGGQLLLAEKLPYRNELEEVYRYLKIQLHELGVPIHFGIEVDEKLVDELNPNIVVFATGSIPKIPDIQGVDITEMTILDPRKALSCIDLIGHKVLVVDNIGYWQGAGLADYVNELGAEVTIVTPNVRIGEDIEDVNLYLLTKRLHENGVKIILNHAVYELKKNTVIVENTYNHDKKELKGFDTVIIADQSFSNNTLYKKCKAARKEVYSVGDCVAPRAIEQVILESEILARQL